MILYKYVTGQVGREILDKNSIRFSQPKNFNDPFDSPFIITRSILEEATKDDKKKMSLRIKLACLRKNTGVLSLTRNPRNTLMWAHYAASHSGAVIGINMVKAGFTNNDNNLIPAQFGSVIYCSIREISDFVTDLEEYHLDGETYDFRIEKYEQLQRSFLFKSLAWAYEEEVRVVRNVHDVLEGQPTGKNTNFSKTEGKKEPKCVFRLPEGSIEEVYFGKRMKKEVREEIYSNHKGKIKFYKCDLQRRDFSVRITEFL